MEIWQWIQKIAFAVLGWSVGYYLGIKQKRPSVELDCIKASEKETYLQLNNVGEQSALDVQVGNARLVLKLPSRDPLYGAIIDFKFDKIRYIEPSKPQKTLVRVYFKGDEKTSDSARMFYSHSLKRFKFLVVTYKDKFGLRYKNKLTDLKVETPEISGTNVRKLTANT